MNVIIGALMKISFYRSLSFHMSHVNISSLHQQQKRLSSLSSAARGHQFRYYPSSLRRETLSSPSSFDNNNFHSLVVADSTISIIIIITHHLGTIIIEN